MSGVSKATQTITSDRLIAVQLRMEQLQKLLQQRNKINPENFPPKFGNEPNENNTISIGSNETKVNKDIWDSMDWECYSLATRTLLDAVFDKKTLATSTLCGRRRSGEARQLDPRKINDIIEIVKRKCNAHESQIKKIIIIKCCDTARSKRFQNTPYISQGMYYRALRNV